MKQFSAKYLTVQGFVAFAVLINGILGVPLNRIIKENSGIISSSPTIAPESNIHIQGNENRGLHIKEDPHKVNTPSAGFPSRADDDENTRTNQELSTAIRTRRSTHDSSENCTVSVNTPVLQADDLETYLNATTFLGVNPQQSPKPTISANQNLTCPTGAVSEIGDEENLRALCPWIWVLKDLKIFFGTPDIYPRYVKEASCLCTSCRENNAFSCIKLIEEVAVWQKTGCKNGLAVMVKKTVPVAAGCVCQKPTTNTDEVPDFQRNE